MTRCEWCGDEACDTFEVEPGGGSVKIPLVLGHMQMPHVALRLPVCDACKRRLSSQHEPIEHLRRKPAKDEGQTTIFDFLD